MLDTYFDMCHNKARHNEGPWETQGSGALRIERAVDGRPSCRNSRGPAGQARELWVPLVSLQGSGHSPDSQ